MKYDMTSAEYRALQTKRKATYNTSEAEEQIALIEWCQAMQGREPRLWWLFHPANGELRDIRTAVKLKKMGVNPGVPDLWLPVAAHGYPGLVIELKAIGGTTRPDQDRWLLHLESQGWYAVVKYGWLASAKTLAWYLDIVDSGLDYEEE